MSYFDRRNTSNEIRATIMIFRFFFVVLWCTAVLIFTVYLRSADNRIFYRYCIITAEQNRLKQELCNKQLQVENLINPAALSHRINKKN